jgi:hypothetical protein
MSRVKKISLKKAFSKVKKVSYENDPIIKSLIKKESDIIKSYRKLIKNKRSF